VDPLADVLDLGRVRGALLASVRAGAPWGLELPQSDGASFHAVTSGTAWLSMEGREPLQLMPGDLLLLPGGASHALASTPGERHQRFDRELKERLMSADDDLVLGGPGAVTTFVCAGYEYDLDVGQPLMRLLPDVVHVPAEPVAGRDVASVVELLAAEVGQHGAGSRSAAARLIDLLLIAAIRRSALTDGRPSWLTALRDPTIAHVLGLMHERPAHPWTLEQLAGAVHLSRATLARRFAEAVGDSPLAYLTQWRMQIAAQRLVDSSATVESIARAVGYRSEYAFNRAFARHRGHPPGRYRRLKRTAAASASTSATPA
jgi:AraC-like DNA-binding protein